MGIYLYKVVHLFGFALLFTAVGGLLLHAIQGGSLDQRGRKLVAIAHGLGLVLILISGFGLLARLGLGFPLWVWFKIAIWLLLGAITVLIRKLPERATLLWWAVPLLGGLAAYLALFKPGP